MSLADLLSQLEPSQRSHATTAFRIADDGTDNVLSVLRNADKSVARITTSVENPNTARNYISAMRLVACMPPVSKLLGAYAEGAKTSLDAALVKLNKQANQRRKAAKAKPSSLQEENARLRAQLKKLQLNAASSAP